MRLELRAVSIGCLLAVLLFACPCAAVNSIGVYADSLATSPCTALPGMVTCYVVMTDVADTVGISGWQFALRIDSGGYVFSPMFPAGSINLEEFPRMLLGCATPIPQSSAVKLMSFTALPIGPTSIYIDRLSSTYPVLVVLASTGESARVTFAYGGNGAPVFAMAGAPCPPPNDPLGGGVVPAANSSWGGIKAMFR